METNSVCIHCNHPASADEAIVIDGNGNPTHEGCRTAFNKNVFRRSDFEDEIRKLRRVAQNNPLVSEAFKGNVPDRSNRASYPRCIALALPRAKSLGVPSEVTDKLYEIRRAMIELCAS
ncbi:MAG: hypothetical protein PHS79_05495 [Patescibacteria group bacterium]|nr:hypothetical protein [Patescibacteria group bacterium]